MSVHYIERSKLAQNVGIGAENAGEIHHFTKTEKIILICDFAHFFCAENATRMVFGRAGNAGRHHKMHVGRYAFHVVDHEFNALFSEYVCNLVRIGVKRRYAFRDCALKILARTNHNRFKMQVRVVERRHDVLALAVNLDETAIFAHANYCITLYRNVAVHYASVENVHYVCVLNDHVGFFSADSGVNIEF